MGGALLVLGIGTASLLARPDAPAEPSSAPSAPAAVPAAPLSASTQLAAREPAIYRELELPRSAPARSAADAPASAASDTALDCLVMPHETVAIGSPVVGLIERIHVDRSDRVEAGEVLVELESGVERANVEVARARALMEGEERARAANARLEERKQQRSHLLYERQVVSLGIHEETQASAEVARLQLEQAREERHLASLQLAQAEEVLRRRVIRSPVSGVVVERLMAPGERVDEQTILKVAQIDPLRVEVTLPSAMFGRIRTGMKAAVEPELPGDRTWVAAVSVVDGVIDAASGTFVAYLSLPNPQLDIPSGLHCRVRFLPD